MICSDNKRHACLQQQNRTLVWKIVGLQVATQSNQAINERRMRITENQAIALVTLIGPVSIGVIGLTALAISGVAAAIVLVITVTIAFVIPAQLLKPKWWGETRVHVYSLMTFSSLTCLALSPGGLWDILIPIMGEGFGIVDTNAPTYAQKLAAVSIVGATCIAFNIVWSKNRILPPSQSAAHPENTEPFDNLHQDRLETYCNYMLRVLDQYDADLHWNDSDYTAIEAEVEVCSRVSSRTRVAPDLVKAIRSDRISRAFLLLGAPGSGKSVSMRRLCRKLLAESSKTGVLPAYINLREWDGPPDPSDQDILDFAYRQLMLASGKEGKSFLKRCFFQMVSHGKVFFIFDSFDEMPCLLDTDDTSSKIVEISLAFDTLLNDIHKCRGVLSSRQFRKPRRFRGRHITARPLSERQMRLAMSRWLHGSALTSSDVLRSVFVNKPELARSLRNPLTAYLLAKHVARVDGNLPSSLRELFFGYVSECIANATARDEFSTYSFSVLHDCAVEIALAMYDSPDIGLEIDVVRLQQLTDDKDIKDKVAVLCEARVMRMGYDLSRVSFSHRRIAEYFVVEAAIHGVTTLSTESIPSDSRWRDCLALYSTVASVQDGKAMARVCWEVISDLDRGIGSPTPENMRPAIHCLRFLRDAFTGKRECLEDFDQELSVVIKKWLSGEDVLAARVASESIGLLPCSDRSECISLALKGNSAWVIEAAFNAARHVGGLDDAALRLVREHIQRLSAWALIQSYLDLRFSLSLSDELKKQRAFLAFDLLQVVVFWMLVAISLCICPSLIVPYALMALLVTAWRFTETLKPEPRMHQASGKGGWLNRWRANRAKKGMRDAHLVRDVARRLGIPFAYSTSIRAAVMLILLLAIRDPLDPSSVPLLTVAFISGIPWDSSSRVLHASNACWRYLVYIFDLRAIGGVLAFMVALSYVEVQIDVNSILETPLGAVAGALLFIAVLLTLVFHALKIPLRYLCLALDVIYIRQLPKKDKITRKWLHRVCSSMKTSIGRQYFIRKIEAQRTEVEGDYTPLPNEKWVDANLREAFARLEMQWVELT